MSTLWLKTVRRRDTPAEPIGIYHCVSRCVRRAFLCDSGKDYNFEHRRGWIVNRLKQLAAVFCIDIAAYAIMSNHYHVVLRVNKEDCDALSMDEVIERWRLLFKGPYLIQQYISGTNMGPEELSVVEEIANDWRERLMDISWITKYFPVFCPSGDQRSFKNVPYIFVCTA